MYNYNTQRRRAYELLYSGYVFSSSEEVDKAVKQQISHDVAHLIVEAQSELLERIKQEWHGSDDNEFAAAMNKLKAELNER